MATDTIPLDIPITAFSINLLAGLAWALVYGGIVERRMSGPGWLRGMPRSKFRSPAYTSHFLTSLVLRSYANWLDTTLPIIATRYPIHSPTPCFPTRG